QQLAQRQTECFLDQTAALDVAAKLNRERAARSPDAVIAVKRRALVQDDRYARQRNHVVDDRRLSEQPFDRRQRRTRTDLAALALEALEHRRLFAADVRTGAEADLEIEPLAAAEDARAQIAARVRRIDRRRQRAVRVRVLDAEI